MAPSSRSADDRVVESVVRVLEEGRLFRYDCSSPEQSATARLERAFAEHVGTRYALAVNSCSSALYLALCACGIGPGDEVLVPAYTFIAVPSAVTHAGATPVLVEMTDDYVVDLTDLERRVTPRTKAVLLSYMRGRVPDLDDVRDVCARHDLMVIEDAAHALGVRWKGAPVGRLGRAAAYSFQSYKLLDSGEGGMLVTDEREVAIRAMVLAGCYESHWSRHFLGDEDKRRAAELVNQLPVYALRMSNLSAAALLPQVDLIDERVLRHQQIYARLVSRLSENPHLRIPGFVQGLHAAPDTLLLDLVDLAPEQIERFVAIANKGGVPVDVVGLGPTNARCFWRWQFFEPNECPHTRALLTRSVDLRLPLWVDETIYDYFGDVIEAALSEAARLDR